MMKNEMIEMIHSLYSTLSRNDEEYPHHTSNTLFMCVFVCVYVVLYVCVFVCVCVCVCVTARESASSHLHIGSTWYYTSVYTSVPHEFRGEGTARVERVWGGFDY